VGPRTAAAHLTITLAFDHGAASGMTLDALTAEISATH